MSTVVTGTLVDAEGQLWSNAPIQFIFEPNPAAPGPYIWSGGSYNPMPPVIYTDSAGHFSITLPANNEFAPRGSFWRVNIGPEANFPAVVLTIMLFTGNLDLGTLFTSRSTPNLTKSLWVPRAYNDGEVEEPPNSGQIYYDVISKALKYWEDNSWHPLQSGGSTGMVWPPAGIAVSSGSNSWSASIDPATLATVSYVDTKVAAIPPQVYPGVGVAASTGTGWATSIPTANFAFVNFANTFAQPQTITSQLVVLDNGSYPTVDITKTSITLTSRDASINFVQASAAADQKFGAIAISPSGTVHHTFFNDAKSQAIDYITAVRSGTTCSELDLTTPLVKASGNITATGNVTTSGTFWALAGTGAPVVSNAGRLWYANSNKTFYLDSAGPDTGTVGQIQMRVYNSDASNLKNALLLDTSGSATFSGGASFQGLSQLGLQTATANIAYVSDSTYIDSFSSSGTRGTMYFRVGAANGANVINGLLIDPSGNCNCPYIGYFGYIGGANTGVRIGGRTGAAPWNSGSPNINGDASNLIINSTNSGGIFFNWDMGNNGVTFGNGAGALVGNIDQYGNASFNGVVQAAAFRSGQLAIPTAFGTYSCYIYNVSTAPIYTRITTTGDGGTRGALAIGGVGAGGLSYLDYAVFTSTKVSMVAQLECQNGLNVTAGGKNFRITHPLDDSKYLFHSCLEGPEIAVFYRGEAETIDGYIVITLPDYFEALTAQNDRSIQLTTIVDETDVRFSSLAAGRIYNGQFTVYSSMPSAKFYWEVKAVRKDIPPLEVVTDKEE